MTVGYLEGQKEKLAHYIKNNQYKNALSIAKEILDLNKYESKSYHIIGKIYSLLEDHQKAIDNYLKAIELNPRCNLNYNSISQSFSALGENEKGIFYLKKALNIVGNDPLTYFNMGLIFDNIEDFDQAAVNFHKAIQLKPYFPDALNNLGNIYYKKMDYERSTYYLKRSINQNKKNNMAFHNLANTKRSMGMYKEAIIFYKKALEIRPKQIESINGLGLTYYDVLQNEFGIECFKLIIEIDNKNYYAKRNLAIGYVKTGNLKKAIILFKEALKELPNCMTSINYLIQLSSYDKNINVENLFNNFFKLLSNVKPNKKNNTQVITLLGFGRSGSLFLHSLLDGHPQISTLPGYFFKGWFSETTWPIFKPNTEESNWRETLAEKICIYFEPQFNAHCKKNVIGKPNHHTEWFAKNLGFTQLGEHCSEVLELDQQKFKKNFVDLSLAYDKIDSRICFELIHEAFDKAYRIPENSPQKNKTIFYHLHNPNHFEYANFLRNYSHSKILYIIRNPIQMLESWVSNHFKKLQIEKDHYKLIEIYQSIYDKIYYLFEFINNPLNSLFENQIRAVKLEDIKRKSKKTIPLISNWIGIKDNHTLYKSEFLNKKFSRPSSNFNNISGFDLSAIDIKEGRFFGKKDILILKTLLWPLLKTYGYTNFSEKEFKSNLIKIQCNLKKPLQFEHKIYNFIPGNKLSLNKMEPHNKLHRILSDTYHKLLMNYRFHHIIKPLI